MSRTASSPLDRSGRCRHRPGRRAQLRARSGPLAGAHAGAGHGRQRQRRMRAWLQRIARHEMRRRQRVRDQQRRVPSPDGVREHAGLAHVRRVSEGLRGGWLRRLLRRQRVREPGLQRSPASGADDAPAAGGDDLRRRDGRGHVGQGRGRDVHGNGQGQRRRHASGQLHAALRVGLQGRQDDRDVLGLQQARQDRPDDAHGQR